ncbi:hypothetical protein ACS0TY_023120 [Phlomoides rotata]
MYPSSASSSSKGSMGSSSGRGGGGGGSLMRYGSAPSTVLSTAVDSVIGATREFSALEAQTHLGPARFFASETSESTSMANHNREDKSKANTTIGLQPAFGFAGGSGGSSSLLRHSSSPAGFLNQLAAKAGDVNGFSISRGVGSYNSKGMGESGSNNISRLNSQLSFTGKETLSRISEEIDQNMVSGGHNNGQKKSTHSYAAAAASNGGGAAAFGMGSWEHTSNPMMFSVAQPNRAKNNVVDSLDNMESQFQFSISQTAHDMASMEKLMNIPQDSVTCKIRAKRGCATHPRSIAERDRRTRISGKLKKLQDLVPNMEKQTSYADMLDLAVQHIVCLQNQVEKLNKGLDSCTCGCKKTQDS